jgi:hypothetical protein
MTYNKQGNLVQEDLIQGTMTSIVRFWCKLELLWENDARNDTSQGGCLEKYCGVEDSKAARWIIFSSYPVGLIVRGFTVSKAGRPKYLNPPTMALANIPQRRAT